jgi:hypothetical protein
MIIGLEEIEKFKLVHTELTLKIFVEDKPCKQIKNLKSALTFLGIRHNPGKLY